MCEVVYQRFGDPVAQILGIGIPTPIVERQHGKRIDLPCSARSQIRSANGYEPDGGDAGGYNDPELATFERLVRRPLRGNSLTALRIPLQPLEVSP